MRLAKTTLSRVSRHPINDHHEPRRRRRVGTECLPPTVDEAAEPPRINPAIVYVIHQRHDLRGGHYNTAFDWPAPRTHWPKSPAPAHADAVHTCLQGWCDQRRSIKIAIIVN